MDEAITIRLKNSLSEIERLARIVEEFGERHQIEFRSVYNMNLALEEVVTNVISYGYDDGAEHEIITRLLLHEGEWTAEVEDDGKPFNPLEAPEPDTAQSLEERRIGGLGIHLVRNLMDQLEYRRNQGKNLLIMSKKVKGA